MVLKTIYNDDETTWIEVDMVTDKGDHIEIYKKGRKGEVKLYFKDAKLISINNSLLHDSRFKVM